MIKATYGENWPYLYGMIQFLKVHIWITPEEDDDTIEKLLKPSQPYKRVALIPMDYIVYMHEGEDRKTTELILEDGDVIVVAEKYDIIFDAWEKWYLSKIQSFISYTSRSN